MRAPAPIARRILFLIAVMTLTAAAIVIFIVLPTTKKIVSLGRGIRDTEAFLETQYQRVRQLRQSIVRLEDLAAAADRFDEATIRPGEELRVITDIEAIAERHGIRQTFTIENQEKETGPQSIRLPAIVFSFTNEGEFPNHLAYIDALQHLPYFVFIDSLSFEKRTTREKTDTVILRFNGKIYMNETEPHTL